MYSLAAKIIKKNKDSFDVELKDKSVTKAYFDNDKQKSLKEGDFISISGPKVKEGWSICGNEAMSSCVMNKSWQW